MNTFYRLRHFSIRKFIKNYVIESYEEQIQALQAENKRLKQAIEVRDAYVKGIFDSRYVQMKEGE